MQLGKSYKASAKRVQTELEPVITSGQQSELNLGKKFIVNLTGPYTRYVLHVAGKLI